ncbi:hypothetical protein Zmor_013558 [Zophobas morio]|uniref:Uncharacterized protein n=1 Tax=Zophobas morio TaxID=2755281 RepID=A0AA38MFU7_9CUCU|nr:hypothetical protein Zmor_013558 [Zophobas morio]
MLNRNDIFGNDTYLPSTHLEHQRIVNWTLDESYSQTKSLVYPERAITTAKYLWFSFEPHLNELGCHDRDGFKITLYHYTVAKRPFYIEHPGSYEVGINLSRNDVYFKGLEILFLAANKMFLLVRTSASFFQNNITTRVCGYGCLMCHIMARS